MQISDTVIWGQTVAAGKRPERSERSERPPVGISGRGEFIFAAAHTSDHADEPKKPAFLATLSNAAQRASRRAWVQPKGATHAPALAARSVSVDASPTARQPPSRPTTPRPATAHHDAAVAGMFAVGRVDLHEHPTHPAKEAHCPAGPADVQLPTVSFAAQVRREAWADVTGVCLAAQRDDDAVGRRFGIGPTTIGNGAGHCVAPSSIDRGSATTTTTSIIVPGDNGDDLSIDAHQRIDQIDAHQRIDRGNNTTMLHQDATQAQPLGKSLSISSLPSVADLANDGTWQMSPMATHTVPVADLAATDVATTTAALKLPTLQRVIPAAELLKRHEAQAAQARNKGMHGRLRRQQAAEAQRAAAAAAAAAVRAALLAGADSAPESVTNAPLKCPVGFGQSADGGAHMRLAADGVDALAYLYQFCHTSSANLRRYHQAFDTCDLDCDGYLFMPQVKKAIRMLNQNRISAKETEYVVAILGVVDSDAGSGVDAGPGSAGRHRKAMSFMQFTVVALLSERVVSLSTPLRQCIVALDMDELEARYSQVIKMFYCADVENTGTIQMEVIELELRAGRVAKATRETIMDQLSGSGANDTISFMDFLLYIPLFVSIHADICTNPLRRSSSIADYSTTTS